MTLAKSDHFGGTVIRRSSLAALALALVSPAVPAASAAAGGAPCAIVDFSPSFATDHTALCARQEIDADEIQRAITVWATTDGGKSWKKQAATGLPQSFTQDKDGPALVDIDFSPQYTADHLVYLALSDQGLFGSTDLGASFQASAPLLKTTRPPWSDVLTPAGNGFLFRDSTTAAYVAPPLSVPVAAAGPLTQEFLVPPDWPQAPALALYRIDGGEKDFGYRLSECDATFTCTTGRHVFGSGDVPYQLWYGATHATLYMYLISVDFARARISVSLQVSTDSGRTFGRWAAADNLLGVLRNPNQTLLLPLVTLAVDATAPRTMDMRVTFGWSRAAANGMPPGFPPLSPSFPPAEQVFRTTDGGSHWTRTGWAPGLGQRGKGKGTLPWTAGAGFGSAAGRVWNPGGGKLFTLGVLETRGRTEYAGIFCSADAGKHWSRTC